MRERSQDRLGAERLFERLDRACNPFLCLAIGRSSDVPCPSQLIYRLLTPLN